MSDYRSAIQRQMERVQLRPYSFEVFQDRRLRTARRRRAGAAGLGLIVGALVVFSVIAALHASKSAVVPAAGPITPANVSGLGLSWTRDTGGSIDSSPVVSGDRVYVTNTAGALLAFPISCPTAPGTCPPVWTGTAGAGSSFLYGSPAVGDGIVFAGSRQGQLVGYPISCGQGTCKPSWVARVGGNLSTASPVVADGVVYVGSGDGRLYAFSERCTSFPRPCAPLWSAALQGGFGRRGYAGATPAVSGGVVYVGSTAGTLYSFPTSCSGGGTCHPLQAVKLPGVINNPIVVDGGTLYVTSGSDLYAFPTGCLRTRKVCEPTWIGHTSSQILSAPAVGDGFVYVGSVGGVVSVFAEGCGSNGRACRPAWSLAGLDQFPNPTVADGVLYVGTTVYPSALEAFRADCGSVGGRCSPLWTFTFPPGEAVTQQVASNGNGALFAASGDPTGSGAGGTIYAFRLGVNPPSSRLGTPLGTEPQGPSSLDLAFYLGLVGIVGLWFVLRRRRFG